MDKVNEISEALNGTFIKKTPEIEQNQKIVDKIQEFANITENFPRFTGDKEHIVPGFCRWVLEEIQSQEIVKK